MNGYINGIDFINIEAEKYWQYPKTYKNDKQKEIRDYILSGQYMGARKMDGCYYRFVKDDDGNCSLIARSESVSGDMTDKYGWIPQCEDFFEELPNGTCLLGEVYFPNNEGSRRTTTIMGCLKDKAIDRQEKGDKLHYYVFDIWAWGGSSMLKTKAEDRFDQINALHLWKTFNYVEYAQYYESGSLWNELGRVMENGGEGIVITRKNSFPEPGKRTARKTLKIKKELDNPVDCFLTGLARPATRLYNGDHIEDWRYWENVKTGEKLNGVYYQEYNSGAPIEPISKSYFNNWASAIELGMVDNNGEIVPVGWVSGITEEVKNGIVNNNKDWKYRVVKVNAMDIENDTHHFRHARIIEWRDDKPWTDCNIDQLF